MSQEIRVLRWVVLGSLLLTALLLYAAGMARGAVILIVLGAGFELVFWVYLFSHRRRGSPPH